MIAIPDKPYIYEINTRVWLTALSRKAKRTITLGNVPDAELDAIADLGFHTVWMMGAWERSPAARRSALNYVHEYRPALPNMTDDDVSGSPYAIYRYEIDPDMGGRRGMASLRSRLAARGLSLLLDFVPNHMATDSPWISQYPGFFVQGTYGDHRRDDFGIFRTLDAWGRTLYVCRGRDPYFPPWIDTAQLNAFNPELRAFVAETLLEIAGQCDGVRCDMAMLMTNRIFEQTWSHYVRDMPPSGYWQDVIPVVKDHYPDFTFIGEVYWDMEFELQRQGFDFTYDKRLYDRLIEGDPEKVRTHLLADHQFQRQSVRFLENHDEPRAADTLGINRQVAAAALAFTLPGALLFFDGQLTGSVIKLPVQLGRAPQEPINQGLQTFYRKLLIDLNMPIYTSGAWWLLELRPPYGEYPSSYNLIAHGWRDETDGEYRVIIVNLSNTASQGIIELAGWTELDANNWILHDVISDESYEWGGAALLADGLYVELGPHGFHIFRFEALPLSLPTGKATDEADDAATEEITPDDKSQGGIPSQEDVTPFTPSRGEDVAQDKRT